MTNGFIGRYKQDQISFMQHFIHYEAKYMYEKMRHQCNFYNIEKVVSGYPTETPVSAIDKDCYTKQSPTNKSVFLWGDSHAQTLFSGLKAELPHNYDILQVASSGCGASLNAQPSKDNFCEQSNWFAYDVIKKTKPDVVIVAQGTGHNLEAMRQISEALEREGVKKVIFIGPSPHWLKPLPNIVALKLWNNTPTHSKYALDHAIIETDKQFIAGFPKSDKRSYISLIDNLCNESGCEIYIGADKATGITAWDQAHITPITSQKIAKELLVPAITINQ